MSTNKTRVITDQPDNTGWLHGYDRQPRRETSNPDQQATYEKGYRRGAKQSAKDLEE